ncbi:MAG: B12-binding domain-containing radical SAM protein [Desulfobacteraceae bacterium]|nr:B12-binding domain-containing radical SAM protein [Desulfobacteraceae bacterium]MBC2757427.1 B12-binding domain-containing radical SAM protein [Desulfobacteraceae bacterium]
MKIVLVNLSSTMSSDGSRLISALLKRSGYSVTNIFLARSNPFNYDKSELMLLDPILEKTKLVLIGVYSSYVLRAIHITEYIKKTFPEIIVVWGGPHCTAAPEMALEFADGVCFSEGDEAVIDFVNKMAGDKDYSDIPNMAFRKGDKIIINKVLPPFKDLDSLPYYDYDFNNAYLLDKQLVPLNREIIKERFAYYPFYEPTFYFLSSRGCPNKCTYCNNSRYISMFGKNSIRFHSVDRIFNELEVSLEKLDFFKYILIADDDFFMRPLDQIENFSKQYKGKIGIPFGVAVSPNTYNSKKMRLLVNAGLRFIQMGVQTGSQRVLDDVFKRNTNVKKTLAVIRELTEYKKSDGIDLLVDFIIDNPYETREDVFLTYKSLLELPIHVITNIFYLTFFPGTPLYEQAVKDGYTEPFGKKTSRLRFFTRQGVKVRYQKNYEMFLILLIKKFRLHCIDHQFRYRRWIPLAVFRFLGIKPLRAIASLFPESFFMFLFKKID